MQEEKRGRERGSKGEGRCGKRREKEGERLFEEGPMLSSCSTDHFSFKPSQGGAAILSL